MKIKEIYKKKQVLSFEIFPKKKTDSISTVYDTLDELKDLEPDFISVTYGAGGRESNKQSLEIASKIKNKYKIESVIHLPCINHTKEEVRNLLDEYKELGIENILALRGDINPNISPKNDFKYASDLIEFIKENGDFNIIAASYPEGHTESSSIIEDIKNLKIKVDAGAEGLITQLFFDNEHFYSFRERLALANIKVPIEAGIMPVTNKKQIERMVSLCGATLPKKFISIIDKYEHDQIALRDAGIAYAIDQIVDLIARGVDGIHLYTMNNPYIARRIYEATYSLLK